MCIYINLCWHFKIYTYVDLLENGSPGDFPPSVTICSLCKWMFVIFPFVDKETNGSYPFANRLNELKRDLPFYARCCTVTPPSPAGRFCLKVAQDFLPLVFS